MKKTMTALLAVLLLASVLTGCGKKAVDTRSEVFPTATAAADAVPKEKTTPSPKTLTTPEAKDQKANTEKTQTEPDTGA